MNGTELALRNEPTVLPPLPPTPIFDEHIDAYLTITSDLHCLSESDFKVCKDTATEGVRLKNQMLEAWKPLTQAIDDIKEPFLERRNGDIGKIEGAVKLVDSIAVAWLNEQKRIAQEAVDKKLAEERRQLMIEREREIERQETARQAEIARLAAEKAAELQMAEDWGTPESVEELKAEPIVEPPPVNVPEIIPPRPVQADTQISYRKGARTKAKLKAKIIDPDLVRNEYRSADILKINAKIANWAKLVSNPTPEQLQKLADDIGGIIIDWE